MVMYMFQVRVSDLKKIILLLLTIFVLSGCQVKYDLEFKDDSLIENISNLENLD